MFRRNNIYHIAIFLLVVFCAFDVYAQEVSSKEPIVVNGDHVTYLQEQKKVIGEGNISITYKDIVLTCDKVTVNLVTHDAKAIGDVKITQKDAYFIGDELDYNFDTRSLAVDYGYINSNPIYGRAEIMDKASGKEEYSLENCNITTCDLDTPHYWMQAKRLKIYLDNKVVADNVVLKVNGFPILYLPYYVQPLRDIPKSHITVIPGRSKEWGYYVLMAYRYYFSDKSRGDILLDYRDNVGLATGVNHYLDSDVGKGAFKFYYTKQHHNHDEEGDGWEESEELDEHRYRYQYRHKWDIKDMDTVATMEFNYLSDRYVIRDYFYTEYEELGANPDSYMSFVTAKSAYTTEFLLRKRFNKFYTVVERLPEYRIDIPSYKIGGTAFYYSANASGVYLNYNSDNATQAKDVNTIRLDYYNQLSYAARFFKALSVTPYAGVRNTYYSRNKWGDTNLIRTLFREGVDTSIKFYKIYDVNTNVLGLDINKLRHIITPTANYYHTHQPTISPDNLTQYDGIDGLDTANGVSLFLENKLQTKRKEGEEMKSVDLLRFIISTDYPFRLEKQRLQRKTREVFNNLDFKLELIPYSWLYITSDWALATKKYFITTENIDLVAHGDKWSLGIGQRFYDLRNGGGDRNNQVTIDARYKISDKWNARAYERFDIHRHKWYQQEYTISRDFHCWELDFTYTLQGNRNHGFWFILRLKAFPDYPIGLQQTYSYVRFGSTGANGPSESPAAIVLNNPKFVTSGAPASGVVE